MPTRAAQASVAPAFRFELDVEAPLAVGDTPTGNRVFLGVIGGTAKGSELDAEGVGNSGDWAIMGADGFGKLDVRMHVKDKSSGEILYITYTGHLQSTPGVMSVLGKADDAQDQAFDSYQHHISMTIETSGKKFAWVNRTIFVGKGSFKFDKASKKSTVSE